MALALLKRPKLTDSELELVELRLENSALQARIANPVAFHNETFVGFGDSSNARTVFNALRGTALSADRVIRQRVQGLDLGVYRRRFVSGDFEDIPAFDHPLQFLLDRPTLNRATGQMTHSALQLWGMAVTQYQSVGECYILVIHDGNQIPVGLQIAQPGTLEPLVQNGQMVGFRLIAQSTSATLSTRDVIRIWNPDPFELFTSTGVMVRNSTKLNMDTFAQMHNEKFYENDATPKIVMETADGVADLPSKTQEEELAISWVKRFTRRFGNAKGAPAWIKPGWKTNVLSSQSDASQIAAMLGLTSQQVMEAYQVSPVMLGRNQDVNRAAAETSRFTFDQNTIEPITMVIADALTTQLASQYPVAEGGTSEGVRLIVKYKPFIARDKEFLLRQEQADLVSKLRSINQVRSAREPSLPDVAWGELPVGTFSDVPYTGEEEEIDLSGFDLDTSAPPVDELPEEVDEGTTTEDATEEEERMRELPIMRRLRAWFTPEREWKRQTARETKWTPIFGVRQRSVFDRQGEITIKRLLERGLERKEYPRTAIIKGRQTPEAVAIELFPIEGWENMFERVLYPVRVGAFRESASAATEAITGQAFELTEAARKIVRAQNLAHYTFVNQTTQDLVVKALADGIEAGDSVQQVARRLSTDVFGVRKKDATRIARTEMAAAVSSAQTEGYKQTGVVERQQWNSSLDDAVRDSHLIDGQTVGLDEQFTLTNGSRASAPADVALPVGDRVNCRCFLTPVFFDEDEAGLGFPSGSQGAL